MGDVHLKELHVATILETHAYSTVLENSNFTPS